MTWAESSPENNPNLNKEEVKNLMAKTQEAKVSHKEEKKKQRMDAFAAAGTLPKPRGRPPALRTKEAEKSEKAGKKSEAKKKAGKRKVKFQEDDKSSHTLDSEEPLSSDLEDLPEESGSDEAEPAPTSKAVSAKAKAETAAKKPVKKIKIGPQSSQSKAGAAAAVIALGYRHAKEEMEKARKDSEKNGKNPEKDLKKKTNN